MKSTDLGRWMAGVFAVTALALFGGPALAANEAEVAEQLIELIKIGRGVVSEQMANINDASKADKGFTGEYMAAQVIDRFKKRTKIDLRIPNVVPQANLYLALVEAEKEVVDEAQPILNKQGISFKGFIPAVFARRTGEHFYKKSGVRLKLTGIDYRNPNNKPDDFEAEVLRGQKTGFFLDQRDNRMRLRSLAAGRTVLNLFSYSGAFSVAALAGGASRAVDVDSSESALALARRDLPVRVRGFAGRLDALRRRALRSRNAE